MPCIMPRLLYTGRIPRISTRIRGIILPSSSVKRLLDPRMFKAFRSTKFLARKMLLRSSASTSSGSSAGGGSIPLPNENVNIFQTVGRFLSKNKQQIMNMIGIYFCFSVAIHNYKMKIAWDEREKEVQKVKDQLSQLETALISETKWIDDTEQRILKAGNKQKGILLEEIMKKVSPIIKESTKSSNDTSILNQQNSVVNTVENAKGKLL